MIQHQLKLRLTKAQERRLDEWLWVLTGVWNFAIRKIELDAKDGIYYTPKGFQNLLANHSRNLDMPSHVLQGMMAMAYTAWHRCFKKIGGKPKLKGARNKLNSIPLPDPIKTPVGNKIAVPYLKDVRFHKQALPDGKIKCGRVVKRASGWYLCLFIDAAPNAILPVASNSIGIDSGFKHLLSLSNGEKVEHPRELEQSAMRLAQAQRGINRKLVARINERIANQRKDRNHKISRKLVSENSLIAFSADNHKGIASKFGKSVASSGHAQLRQMLAYKSIASGRLYVEVDNRNSTRTCSVCGALTGPQGWAGLSVRHWMCGCGAKHDRDTNAAINTLMLGMECASNLEKRYA
jgi:transposase